MCTLQERRKKQAKAYLEQGFSRDETLLYLVGKNCTAASAEKIVGELTKSPTQNTICKRLLVGGLLFSGALINLIIYSVTGYIHYGAFVMMVFVPLGLAISCRSKGIHSEWIKKFGIPSPLIRSFKRKRYSLTTRT